jgi:hypothetical protein
MPLLYFIIVSHVMLFLISFNQSTIMQCHSIRPVSTYKMTEIVFSTCKMVEIQFSASDFSVMKYAFTPWSASTTRCYEPI